jgi:hypothetical protein
MKVLTSLHCFYCGRSCMMPLLHYVLLWEVMYEGIDIITFCFSVGGHV